MRFARILCCAALAVCAFGVRAQQVMLDKVVAVVGGSSITYSEVENTARRLTESRREQGYTSDRDPMNEALEQLMMQKLLYNQALIDSVEIMKTDIMARVEEEVQAVPESVIALTFVALGTSLPELVTAITSLAKGHGALSLGNVIGANVFNLVLVSGVSVTLAPFSIPQNSTIAGMNASLVMDIPVMFAVMLLLTLPALIKGKLSRPQGIALLCIYAAFCAVQFSI